MDALIEFLYGKMEQRLAKVTSGYHRYLFDRVKWKGRMFAIVGPKGVGKTTMFLQYIKENGEERPLYVSADNLVYRDITLLDLADRFTKMGGMQLFIDEIHKYKNWSIELKLIYDEYPDLKVGITGSSILDIYKGAADLSRRMPVYLMQGLSFREYLKLSHDIDAEVFSLQEILAGKANIPHVEHPLPIFHDYLRKGYYPFSIEAEYELELMQVINQTLEVDIPQYAGMNASTGRKLKQLLSVIAKNVPFKPVKEKLAAMIGVGRNDIGDYLLYIEKAQMIGQLRDATGGIRGIGKVEKIYLDNTNIAYILGQGHPDLGNLRETFFFNQMRVHHDVISSKTADFQIGEYTFEVGGPSKGQRQIAEVQHGFIVKDGIEFPYARIIPLWHFGLNY